MLVFCDFFSICPHFLQILETLKLKMSLLQYHVLLQFFFALPFPSFKSFTSSIPSVISRP